MLQNELQQKNVELSEQIDKYNQLLMSRTANAFASEPAVDSAPREEVTGNSDKNSQPATDMASGMGLLNMQ